MHTQKHCLSTEQTYQPVPTANWLATCEVQNAQVPLLPTKRANLTGPLCMGKRALPLPRPPDSFPRSRVWAREGLSADLGARGGRWVGRSLACLRYLSL